jgi:hypothetical protein
VSTTNRAGPRVALAAAAALALSACTTITAIPVESPPALATDVYFYPRLGQSPEQQDRDRYECYGWARRESGFDPSTVGPHARNARVIAAPPPNADATAGAVTGGVLGAAIGRTVGGAALGALAGGLIGAAADADREQTIARMTAGGDVTGTEASRAESYRRAMRACLTGRGYTVG